MKLSDGGHYNFLMTNSICTTVVEVSYNGIMSTNVKAIHVMLTLSGFLSFIINLLCHVYDIFMTVDVVLVMSRCHNKDISNNVIFAFKMSQLSE